MPTRLVCPQGHHTELPSDPAGNTADWPKACPVCGAGELEVDEAAPAIATFSLEPDSTSTPRPEASVADMPTVPPAAPVSAPPALQLPGFEILAELGRGGMGVVYRARQTRLERAVAIKVLPAEFSRDPTFAERFTREAKALARLSHPHIITIFDFGQHQEQSYFVMELIEGHNLRQRMRSGPMPPREAIQLIGQICDALQYAHDIGIVHRDIKPENVLLDQRGRLKIADFGLARLLTGPRQDYTLTGPMQVLGTWHYMAPEQLDNPLALDHRADIYAVGVMLYELLTGERPIGRFDLPSHKVPVDARVDEIVLKALEKDPKRRYQSAAEMKAALEAAMGGESVVVAVPVATPITPGALSAVSESATLAMGQPATGQPATPSFNRQPYRAPAAAIVKAPAICLLVAGGLAAFIALLLLFSAASEQRNWGDASASAGVSWAFCFGVLGLLQGVMLIICAIRMLQVESYPLAKTGAILALVPLSPAWLVSLPMGIWALVVLSKPEVRVGFGVDDPSTLTLRTPQPVGPPHDTMPAPDAVDARGWFRRAFATSYGWTLLVCLAGVLFILAPWAEVEVLTSPFSSRGSPLATVHGYQGAFGWVPAGIFLGLFWILFIAGGKTYTPIWRPLLTLAAALVILIVSIVAASSAGSPYQRSDNVDKRGGDGKVEAKAAFRGSVDMRVFPNLDGPFINVPYSGHATPSGATVEFDPGGRRWSVQIPELTSDRVSNGRADSETIRRRLQVSAEAGLYCTLILSVILLLICTLQLRGIVQGPARIAMPARPDGP